MQCWVGGGSTSVTILGSHSVLGGGGSTSMALCVLDSSLSWCRLREVCLYWITEYLVGHSDTHV